jgi:hypothetical protein
VNFGAIGKGYALDRMGEVLRAQRRAPRALSARAQRRHSRSTAARARMAGGPAPRLADRRAGPLGPRTVRGGAALAKGRSGLIRQSTANDYGPPSDPRQTAPSGEGVHHSEGRRHRARRRVGRRALSTAFLIGGPELARRYCAAHHDVLAVLVLDQANERTEVFGRYHGATLEMLT